MNLLARLRHWYIFLGANKFMFSESRCLTCKNRSELACVVPAWVPEFQLFAAHTIDPLEGGIGCMLWKPSALYRRIRKNKHGYEALDEMRKLEQGKMPPDWLDGVSPAIPNRVRQ